MSATTIPAVNGSRLLEAVNFDRYICAAIITQQANWEELLDSIQSPNLRRDVAAVVFEIRQSLGLPGEFAESLYRQE